MHDYIGTCLDKPYFTFTYHRNGTNNQFSMMDKWSLNTVTCLVFEQYSSDYRNIYFSNRDNIKFSMQLYAKICSLIEYMIIVSWNQSWIEDLLSLTPYN